MISTFGRIKTLAQALAIGGALWKKGHYHRVYFNGQVKAELLGLELTYYKSGNIKKAVYLGEKISNNRANKMMDCALFFDVTTGTMIHRY